MRIELPGEKFAVIYSQDDLTERSARIIEAAYIDAMKSGVKLSKRGVEIDDITADDPDIEAKLEKLYAEASLDDINRVRAYEAVLIVEMVKSWDVKDDLPTADTVLELPRGVFTVLAAECGKEFNRKPDFSMGGNDDPKAPTGS